MTWLCRRCSKPMYAVTGPDGPKAMCSGCSQYVDCARCSSAECGDTKCISCYNKAVAGEKLTPSAPIVPTEDQDL